MKHKKPITGKEIIEEIRRGRVSLQSIKIDLDESYVPSKDSRRIDVKIVGRRADLTIDFITEIKALSTPKIFMEAIAVLKEKSRSGTRAPLLVCPFLSEEQLEKLESEGINGVDLCGNGVINISGKVSIFRTGHQNLFPTGGPIKNVYRKNSSMVGRTLLARSRFDSVTQLTGEIGKRDLFAAIANHSSLTFGTVSKTLSKMVQDLIAKKDKSGITLLQPEKLVEELARNYTGPYREVITLIKVDLDDKALIQRLTDVSVHLRMPIVATGLSSVSRYAVMERESNLAIYCPRADELMSRLGSVRTNRFPNCEIHETGDATVYFDAYDKDGFYWASPIQTYLELMSGDKRDQETAGQVWKFILDSLKRQDNE